MQASNYGLTIGDRILNVIKETDPDNPYKSYWDGDPGEIPKEQLPALVVDQENTEIDLDATQMDKLTRQITVKVVCNMATYMEDFDNSTVSWKKALVLYVEGTDTTDQYDPSSLVNILRTKLTLSNYAVDNRITVKYGQVPRNTVNDPDDGWTGEAHITMTVSHLQVRPSTS